MAFIYSRPSDNLLLDKTPIVHTGTVDPEYPATNLNNLEPETPAKLLTTSGRWVCDLGSSQILEFFGMAHCNADAALANVKFEAHTSNAWGAPLVSQAITIPARYADNHPVNVWLNLKSLIPLAANRTVSWVSIVFGTANSQAIAIGEWSVYGTSRDFGVRNIKFGSDRHLDIPAITHKTELQARNTYDLGITTRAVAVEQEMTTTVMTEIETLARGARGVKHIFPIVPDDTENDYWLVNLAATRLSHKRDRGNARVVTLEFEEASRGLYP